jgi:sporulation protein YlmC with PRC-barrel domain
MLKLIYKTYNGVFMDIKDFLGKDVVDKEGQSVGKIDNAEFNENDGEITEILIKLDKGVLSRDTDKVSFDKIDKISDVVLLNIKIDMD